MCAPQYFTNTGQRSTKIKQYGLHNTKPPKASAAPRNQTTGVALKYEGKRTGLTMQQLEHPFFDVVVLAHAPFRQLASGIVENQCQLRVGLALASGVASK